MVTSRSSHVLDLEGSCDVYVRPFGTWEYLQCTETGGLSQPDAAWDCQDVKV